MKYLLFAILCSSALTLFLRAFSEDSGNRYGILLGNYIACCALAFCTSQNRASLFSLSIGTIALCLYGGIFYLLGILAIQSSLRENGSALTSAFSKLGMTVTLTVSAIFFHETLSALSVLGIFIALAAILVINHDPDQHGKVPALLLITFAANGLADLFAKLFEEFCSPSEENGALFLLFFIAGILTFILSVRERHQTGKAITKAAFLTGILAGIPNYCASLFMIRALNCLPAVFVYPVFSVGTILTVMTCGSFLFHEHLNGFQKIGLLLVILALIFLNL